MSEWQKLLSLISNLLSEIFLENKVNTMPADALAPDGARASWAMILTM